jgi:hypothetical protein
MGNDLENQVVVAKIFNPYGRGVWYLLNSDPEDPDYIWAIVDLFDVETGSVSRKELEELRVPPFNLGLERDLYFPPISAKSLYEGLKNGKTFADGGTLATTEVITDKNGEAWLFPNNPDGKDFGVRLADGGEVDEDYHSAFRKYIEYKFRGKNYNGWKFYVDNLSGTFYWIKDNVEVMATPFYDGYDALPIDIIKIESGDPLYQDTLEFNPTNVLEVDEKRYFALLSSYLMVVDGQEFKKGGKMPIVRTQFEEEEFEYADGGKVEKAFEVILQNPNGKMNKRAVLLAKTKDDASKKALNLKEFKQYGYVVISVEEIKYADGGQTDWASLRKEIDNRNMTIRFKIASIIGLDKAIEYLERDYVISPFRLIEAAVSKEFITIDEIDEKLWDAARYEADDIDSSYRDSGEGIGGSDMNAFVSYMLNDAGIKVGVVDGRYTRMADGGYTSSFSGTPTRRSRLTMEKGGMAKKSTFKDKVKAISARLEGTKVKSKYKGKYGATYDKKEAKEAASNIVGKLRAKYGK